MLLKREGFPEEGELVFCTVTKIQYHAVTVQLDEYPNLQGLIHISEVSPGRIRNIRDFVVEGKKVVCKVIRVDSERGHIDLSLRRVNESQKRNKTDAIKQEQKAEKILAVIAERLKKKPEELYKEVAPFILEEYLWLHDAFEDVVENNASLEKIGLKKETADILEEIIKDKIKPKKVEIILKIAIKVYDENGLEVLHNVFDVAKKIDSAVQINYLGGGNYRMLITAKDYKKAEAILKEIQEKMTDFIEEKKGAIKFERQEK
ncbi:MAG: S1 RNA-binding domain-containing protein [Nanoarchaeota archaeon]|nr:S1 RNA-binding domain-containing protein [Nanoarchaeota archaeon]MBU1322417.1 S1 RNA-binding domain-containing protein [Nanoarchaeota archaeon]MBU1598166.1 S1 RNA-binding domain-containing protein [Nanoarchaeota archaeon]MBU2441427.1 S1 RNA-binding domain-containing protein [Nanoarchaeota archaeon]